MPFEVTVPNVPGVPAVAFSLALPALVEMLVSDVLGVFGAGLFGQQWGIFLGGAPIIIADTVTAVQFQQGFAISDYPVEQGGFESYDKVYQPFTATIRFTAGGSQSNRQAMLDSINAVIGDLNLYDIVTPEAIYMGVSIVGQDYARAADQGLGLLSVDVRVEEVRETVVASSSNTASPTDASQTNTGTVQGVAMNSSGSPDDRNAASTAFSGATAGNGSFSSVAPSGPVTSATLPNLPSAEIPGVPV